MREGQLLLIDDHQILGTVLSMTVRMMLGTKLGIALGRRASEILNVTLAARHVGRHSTTIIG